MTNKKLIFPRRQLSSLTNRISTYQNKLLKHFNLAY